MIMMGGNVEEKKNLYATEGKEGIHVYEVREGRKEERKEL